MFWYEFHLGGVYFSKQKLDNYFLFCEKCGENMERDPVKTNITVQLPVRPEQAPVKKKSRRMKYTKPEEQVRHLRRVLRWVWLVLIVSLLAFAGAHAENVWNGADIVRAIFPSSICGSAVRGLIWMRWLWG